MGWTRSLSTSISTALVAAGLALSSAGLVAAGEPAPGVKKKAASDTELSRFLETTRAHAKASKPAPEDAPAAICEADQQRVNMVGTLNNVEQQLSQLRKQQLERWAEKGWTAKEAAAAGESVMLNGSGYNVSGAATR